MVAYDKRAFNGVNVSDAIKSARVGAGLTQQELANRFGYARRTIISWELGEREPSIAVFLAILDMCGASVEELFNVATLGTPDRDAAHIAHAYARLDEESKEFVSMVVNRELARQVKPATSGNLQHMNLQ